MNGFQILWTVYQRRGELHEGKASVLSRQLVFDEADVVGQEIGVWRQQCQDGLNRGQGGYISEDDGCTEVNKSGETLIMILCLAITATAEQPCSSVDGDLRLRINLLSP